MMKPGFGIGAALLVGALGAGACSSKGTAATGGDAGAGADGGAAGALSVTFGPITVAANFEKTQCVVVPLGNDAPIHVGQIHNVLGPASHHLIVYKVNETTARPVPFDCQPFTDALDPAKGSPIMVTQKKDDLLTLPAGVAYTLAAHQMLRIEMHYINATSAPVTLTATSTFTPMAEADFHDEAGFLFIGDPDIALPPNAATTLGPVFFKLPEKYATAKFFAITGHEHKLGTKVKIATATSKSDPGTSVYDVPNWSWDEPATVVPATPFSIPAGGGFQFSCAWNNTSAKQVAFGESANDEMCFFWAYYYPSTGANVCFHSEGAKLSQDFCCPGSSDCDAFIASADGGKRACNTLANTGPVVQVTAVASDAPVATGGGIPDGTYVVTAATAYTGAGGASGPTGQTYQATNRSAAGHYDYVAATNGGADDHTGGVFTTNGSSLDAEQTCPIPQNTGFKTYSSDGVSTFTGYIPGTPTQAFTFTKQ